MLRAEDLPAPAVVDVRDVQPFVALAAARPLLHHRRQLQLGGLPRPLSSQQLRGAAQVVVAVQFVDAAIVAGEEAAVPFRRPLVLQSLYVGALAQEVVAVTLLLLRGLLLALAAVKGVAARLTEVVVAQALVLGGVLRRDGAGRGHELRHVVEIAGAHFKLRVLAGVVADVGLGGVLDALVAVVEALSALQQPHLAGGAVLEALRGGFVDLPQILGVLFQFDAVRGALGPLGRLGQHQAGEVDPVTGRHGHGFAVQILIVLFQDGELLGQAGGELLHGLPRGQLLQRPIPGGALAGVQIPRLLVYPGIILLGVAVRPFGFVIDGLGLDLGGPVGFGTVLLLQRYFLLALLLEVLFEDLQVDVVQQVVPALGQELERQRMRLALRRLGRFAGSPALGRRRFALGGPAPLPYADLLHLLTQVGHLGGHLAVLD